jgi:hypothetical protein
MNARNSTQPDVAASTHTSPTAVQKWVGHCSLAPACAYSTQCLEDETIIAKDNSILHNFDKLLPVVKTPSTKIAEFLQRLSTTCGRDGFKVTHDIGQASQKKRNHTNNDESFDSLAGSGVPHKGRSSCSCIKKPLITTTCILRN